MCAYLAVLAGMAVRPGLTVAPRHYPLLDSALFLLFLLPLENRHTELGTARSENEERVRFHPPVH